MSPFWPRCLLLLQSQRSLAQTHTAHSHSRSIGPGCSGGHSLHLPAARRLAGDPRSMQRERGCAPATARVLQSRRPLSCRDEQTEATRRATIHPSSQQACTVRKDSGVCELDGNGDLLTALCASPAQAGWRQTQRPPEGRGGTEGSRAPLYSCPVADMYSALLLPFQTLMNYASNDSTKGT